MKKHFKYFIISVLYIFFHCHVYCQSSNTLYNLPNFTPASPGAASLAKSITYPVNHGTGLVDIKIPLYDVKIGDITVPIYLTYHASGIRVQSPFSWVGAGWSLVAEPAVSRIVDGLPDEQSYYFATYVAPYQADQSYLFSWLNDNAIDKMPDKFFYRLMDKSGGFNFRNSTHDIVIHPYEPIKIVETIGDNVNSSGFTKFTITDEKGLIYTFGGDYIETTSPDESSITDRSCWKGSSIESKKTNSIVNFTYYYPNTITEYFPNNYVRIEQNTNKYDPCDNSWVYLSDTFKLKAATIYDSYSGITKVLTQEGTLQELNTSFPKPEPSFGHTSRELQLHTIQFGNYSVVFNREEIKNGYYLLKNIQVVDNNGRIVKRIYFSMSRLGDPFYEPSTYFNKEPLYKLDSIRIAGNDIVAEETYKFNYYNPGAFPHRNSRNFDHWGYYNGGNGGNNQNKSLVPLQGGIILDLYNNDNQKKSISIGAADRDPYFREDFIIIGVLKDIIYPTGGKTTFVYEQNKYGYQFENYNAVNNGGGLRIKEITEDPGDENSRIINIRYEYSNGICKKPPLRHYNGDAYPFVDYFSQKNVTVTNRDVVCGPLMINSWTYFSDPLDDINTSNGAPVVYPVVTEYINNDIKTVYYYNYYYGNTPIIKKIDSRDDWTKGQIDSIIEYKKLPNQIFKVIRKKKYAYQTYNATETPAYKYENNVKFIGFYSYSTPDLAPPLSQNFYNNTIYSGCERLEEEKEILFDDNQNQISTKTRYDYRDPGESERRSNLCYPRITEKEIEKQINNNDSLCSEIVREEIFYPQNITLLDSAEQARKLLINFNAIGTPLKKNVTRGKVSDDFFVDYGSRPVSSTCYNYKLFGNSTFPQLSTINTGKDENSREEQVQFLNYNKYGKPMFMISNCVDKTVFLWGYKGEQLIAEIKNASYTDVANALSGITPEQLSDMLAPDMSKVEALRNHANMTNAFITTYTYKPLVGIATITDARGIITTYDYDSFNRLWLIKDNNNKVVQKFEYNYRN